MIYRLVFVTAALWLLSAGLAWAQAPVRSLANLGYANDAELTWAAPERFYQLPINDGFTPTTLDLHVTPSPGLPSGYLRAQSDGQLLGQFALTDTTTRLQIPLRRGTVRDGTLPLSLSLHLRAATVGCTDRSADRLTILDESTLHLRGQAFLPSSIQSFFPPHLERVVFYVPDPVPPAAAQAALWLTASLTQRYATAPTVMLATLPDDDADLAASPSTRALRWHPEAPASLDVLDRPSAPHRHAVLTLGRLDEAAQLFRTPGGHQLAMGSTLHTEAITLNAPHYPTAPTLEDLGYANLQASGRGSVSALVRFDLLRFAADRRPSQLRLVAQHTPLADTHTGAFAQFFLNGHLIHSELLDGHALGTTMDLPPHHLRRTNTLEMRFTSNATTTSHGCTDDLPFSVAIDPASALITTTGQAPIAGFERFPSARAQGYEVYVADGKPSTVQHAIELVRLLQGATELPLVPRLLMDLDETTAAPLLAVGSAALTQRLPSRIVASPDGRLSVTGLGGALQFTADAPHAVLQSIRRGRQDVLLFHTTDAPVATRFFDALHVRGGWSALSGVVAASGPDGQLAVLDIDRAHDPFAAQNEASAKGFVLRHATPLSIIAVLLLLVGIAYLMYRARWLLPRADAAASRDAPAGMPATRSYNVTTLYGSPPAS
ncbi:MAG: cellulose biosynthesis cyclic di-GMP-binding regulatory protein BcsB [Bacteroidota bacterium]